MNLAALHRLCVGFTASLVAASIFSDLLAVLLKKDSLRAAAAWTLGYAAIITPFTALAGYLWWNSLIYPDQRRAMPHLWAGLALAAALVPLAMVRARMLRRAYPPRSLYLLVAAIVFGASVFQGNLGREALAAGQQASQLEGHDCHMDSMSGDGPGPSPATAPAAASQGARYTCPMHPNVTSDHPATCPRCGMRLVERKETAP